MSNKGVSPVSLVLVLLILILLGLIGYNSLMSTVSSSRDNYLNNRSKGDSLFSKGQKEVAAQHYKKALEFKPEDRYVKMQLGKLAELDGGQFSALLGGEKPDMAYDVVPAWDGGFIAVGRTYSYGTGTGDAWMLRLDENGQLDWRRTHGGPSPDHANSIIAISQNRYLVVGSTESWSNGKSDVWLMCTDEKGRKIWEKHYGGENSDIAIDVCQLADGSFAVAGATQSFGAGESDAWILHLDSEGDTLWTKTFGGVDWDSANAIYPNGNDGFLVCGHQSKVKEETKNKQIWISSFDLNGEQNWEQFYGTDDSEMAYDLSQTAEGNWSVVGAYSDGKNQDALYLVFSDKGELIEKELLGGKGKDVIRSVAFMPDQGWWFCGYSESGAKGKKDAWILKRDLSGEWTVKESFGGPSDDSFFSVLATSDGGCILAGYQTVSGQQDFWIMKLDKEGKVQEETSL